MQSPVDQMELKQGLMQDLAQSEQMAAQSAQTRGAPQDQDFAPKAIRIKNRKFAEKELGDAGSALEQTLQHLKQESAFKDDIEAGQFEHGMRKKMNQFKFMLMRQALEAEKQAVKQGLDRAKKQKMAKAFGGLIGNVAGALFGGAAGAKVGGDIGSGMVSGPSMSAEEYDAYENEVAGG